MKRLWFIPILLALIIAVSLWSMFAISGAADRMEETTEQIVQAAQQGDRNQAADLAQQLVQQWQEANATLSLFLYRGDLDEIATKASEIHALAQSGELDDCAVESRECARMVEHLRESESFHLGVFW